MNGVAVKSFQFLSPHYCLNWMNGPIHKSPSCMQALNCSIFKIESINSTILLMKVLNLSIIPARLSVGPFQILVIPKVLHWLPSCKVCVLCASPDSLSLASSVFVPGRWITFFTGCVFITFLHLDDSWVAQRFLLLSLTAFFLRSSVFCRNFSSTLPMKSFKASRVLSTLRCWFSTWKGEIMTLRHDVLVVTVFSCPLAYSLVQRKDLQCTAELLLCWPDCHHHLYHV